MESFFAPNRSQSESEKNDKEEEQCINQEETDEDRRKPKKSLTFQQSWLRDHTWLSHEKEAYVRRKEIIEVYKGMPGPDSAVKRFEVQSIVIDPLFKYDEKKVLTPIT